MLNRKLIFAEHQRIETERLILRPVTMADALDMYEYASDAETTTYVFVKHQSLQETKESIANYFMAEPYGKFAIVLKHSGKMIGTIDLRVIEQHQSAEIGYVLNKAFWGHGYVPEAAAELLRFGFEELELIRIFSQHDINNPKSGRVMEKIGMKKEGLIPNARVHLGQPVTDSLRGITVEQWQKHMHQKKSKETSEKRNA